MMRNAVVAVFLISVLFFTSIDTFGINGVIPLIQTHFNISSADSAIIGTATSAMHTATLAVMWLGGELVQRRALYIISLTAWITFSLLAILLGSQSFLVFVAFRSLASSASSVCVILSPVMMTDLFKGKALGIALMLTEAALAAPGATLAQIFASIVVSSSLPWRTVLLPGPVPALIPLLALACLMKKAPRAKVQLNKTIFSGAFNVLSIKSFCLMTAGVAISSFQFKGRGFWTPSTVLSAWTYAPEAFYGLSYPTVTTLNSMSMLAGTLVGMPLVLWLGQSWHHGTGPFSGRAYFNAYPILLGVGIFLNFFTDIVHAFSLDWSFAPCLVANFFSGVGASTEISLGYLIMLMVLPNSSRTTGMALCKLIMGLVTIPAAQIVGFLSDLFLGSSELEEDRFHAYRNAVLCTNFLLVVGGGLHLATMAFFERDCKRSEEEDGLKDVKMDESASLMRSEKETYDTIRRRASTDG